MDPLLKRQIRKYLSEDLKSSEDLLPFLNAINRSYANFSDQAAMIQRAMSISSQELFEANNVLRKEASVLKEVIHRLKEVSSSFSTTGFDRNMNNEVELDTNDLVKFLDNQTREIVEMNIERDRLFNDLAMKNQELNDYAHMVSHDLKSPLRNINALTSWLQEDYKDKIDKEGSDILTLINNNVEKMDALVNGILDYSSIGEIKTDLYEIDLENLLLDLMKVIFIPNNIEIKVNKLPIVKGDKFRLQQVFQNLIDNAIKYNDKEKGIVEIGYEDKDEFWEFFVKDNGKGIDRVYFEKIFDTFQKLDSSDNSTGIGLSIIKKIVHFYGGKIWLESALKKGTTFYFTLKK